MTGHQKRKSSAYRPDRAACTPSISAQAGVVGPANPGSDEKRSTWRPRCIAGICCTRHTGRRGMLVGRGPDADRSMEPHCVAGWAGRTCTREPAGMEATPPRPPVKIKGRPVCTPGASGRLDRSRATPAQRHTSPCRYTVSASLGHAY